MGIRIFGLKNMNKALQALTQGIQICISCLLSLFYVCVVENHSLFKVSDRNLRLKK